MGNFVGGIDLGVILCKHCLKVIDTIDVEKVTTYYSDCKEQDCMERRAQKDQEETMC
jgi:hypothetical protein